MAVNGVAFGLGALDATDLTQLHRIVRKLRLAIEDFEE